MGGAGPFGQLLVSPRHDFQWLCDAHFTMAEAEVACRQMGYANAIRVVENSLYGDYTFRFLSLSVHTSFLSLLLSYYPLLPHNALIVTSGHKTTLLRCMALLTIFLEVNKYVFWKKHSLG